jgi:hypothetical protein
MSRLTAGPTIAFAIVAVIVWLSFERETAAAALFAIVGLLLVSSLLYATGEMFPTAKRNFPYGVDKRVTKGRRVPHDALNDPNVVKDDHYTMQRGAFFRGLYLGDDGRTSTSKLQLLIWTYAILWAMATVFIAAALGEEAGLDSLLGAEDERWAPYLVLLGGPFAAYVLAKGITSAAAGGAGTPTESKPGLTSRANEVVTNEQGETDIVDLQYFLFNLLALSYFLIRFISEVHAGLPELPSILVALTGASAATYVGKKLAEQEKPSITAVFPATVKPDGELDLWGRSLASRERDGKVSAPPKVAIRSEVVPPDQVTVEEPGSSLDHLRVRVPGGLSPGSAKITVVTAAGVSAEAVVDIA